MSVWVCIPSARPAEHVRAWAEKWRERGYKPALWIDENDERGSLADYTQWSAQPSDRPAPGYPGYAVAVNWLIAFVMGLDPQAEWFVIGGDDVYPDANFTAEEIAAQCRFHFEDLHRGHAQLETFGVMQPTGDRFGETANPLPGALKGAYADRVCGSAWLGREFCRRVNQGRGPLWPEYFHMGADEELQEIALRLGILWQRRDVTHFHKHWTRREGQAPAVEPAFLKDKNSPEAWQAYKKLFAERKAAAFPGAGLIP